MNKGFTLIEVVISLMITSISVLLLSSLLQLMSTQDYSLYKADDEKSIHQMRLLYALSKDFVIHGDMLYFRYLNKDMNFYFNGEKLLLEEGYQVFFNHLTKAYFTSSEDCYYFHYQRNGDIKKRVIGCE